MLVVRDLGVTPGANVSWEVGNRPHIPGHGRPWSCLVILNTSVEQHWWNETGFSLQQVVSVRYIFLFSLSVLPIPPCQLSLWGEAGVPGENPRPSGERWLLISHGDWVFKVHLTGDRTRNFRGERIVVWPLTTEAPNIICGIEKSQTNYKWQIINL